MLRVGLDVNGHLSADSQERLNEDAIAKIFERPRDAYTDAEAATWAAVDLLRRMYQAPDSDTAHRPLIAFCEWTVEVDVDEVTRLATTIDTWRAEVLAFFDTRASNAPTESVNVKIKSIRRAIAGYATVTTTGPASCFSLASPAGSDHHEDQALQHHNHSVTHPSGKTKVASLPAANLHS